MAESYNAADVNGSGFVFAEAKHDADLAQLYNKIFQIQDAVFAGAHPRLKLPADVLQTIAQTRSSAANATGTGLNGSLPGLADWSQSQGSVYKPQAASSAFDPVLLEESEDLKRASRNIKRQRIERSLEEQAGTARQGKGKDWAPEYETSINVDDILRKAHEVIPPVSGLEQESEEKDGESSESFDENDYYSSQAMSWSTEQSDEAQLVPSAPVHIPGVDARTDAQQGEKRKLAAIDDDAAVPMPFVVDVVGQASLNPAYRDPAPVPYQPSAESQYQPFSAAQLEELPDEDPDDDYSPPPPDTVAAADMSNDNSTPGNQSSTDQLRLPRYVPDPRYEYNRERPTSPQAVIHSRIRSPWAPQPARVSPLALGKMPAIPQQSSNLTHAQAGSLDQMQQVDDNSGQTSNGDGTPRNRSPVPPKGSIKNSKKRKRQNNDNDDADLPGQKSADRRMTRKERRQEQRQQRKRDKGREEASPEPYIKPEPVSPPPFSGFSDVPNARRQASQREYDDVQVLSPRDARTRPVYREYGYDDRPVYRYADPLPPTYARVVSPSSGLVRRVERDDIDLRRVASLQYARRPYSPTFDRERGAVVEQMPPRAVSYAYPERGREIYREPSVRPQQRYSAVPRDRSRSPIYLDERGMPRPMERVERLASPAGMMPPPSFIPQRVAAATTIITDNFGNRYYATPAPPEATMRDAARMSVAPPSREYDYDAPARAASVIYERPPRASVIHELAPPRGRVYEYDLPPPPIPQRRPVDPSEAIDLDLDRRSYRQRDYSSRPLERERGGDIDIRERGHDVSMIRPLDRERGADAPMLPLPAPAPPQRRPGGQGIRDVPAVEGRQLLRYDEDDDSRDAPPLVSGRDMLPPPPPQMRSYSVRPEGAGRRREFVDDGMAPSPWGQRIVRGGTALPAEMGREVVMDGRKYGVVMDRPPAYGRVPEEFAGGRRGYRL